MMRRQDGLVRFSYGTGLIRGRTDIQRVDVSMCGSFRDFLNIFGADGALAGGQPMGVKSRDRAGEQA